MSLDSTFGAILLGIVVGAFLFGLTTLQTHFYYQRFPNDGTWLKSFVAGIWLFDALHVILCTHTIYHYLITNFGNGAALKHEVWSMAIQTIPNGIIGVAVELFFARRVFILSKNYIITGIIVVFSLIHFNLGIYFTVRVLQLQEFQKFAVLTWVTCLGLGSAAAADIIIAISLVHSLRNVRTGITRTDNIISTLIIYAINTGAVTSLVATICVFCFAFMPTNFIWLSFFWIFGKLYSNSLLANLNSREALRGRGRTEDGPSVILPLSQDKRYSINNSGIKINVTTETIREQYSPGSTSAQSQSSMPPWNRPVAKNLSSERQHHHFGARQLESVVEFASVHTTSIPASQKRGGSSTYF